MVSLQWNYKGSYLRVSSSDHVEDPMSWIPRCCVCTQTDALYRDLNETNIFGTRDFRSPITLSFLYLLKTKSFD